MLAGSKFLWIYFSFVGSWCLKLIDLDTLDHGTNQSPVVFRPTATFSIATQDVSRNRREEPRLQGAGGAENRSILGRM
jgi:hypothetical protein